MRTVSVSKFFPRIAVYAEACPDFVMQQAVVDTVNDICRRTGCVVSEAAMDVKKGEAHYHFALPPGLKAESVLRMYCDGSLVRPTTMDELERRYSTDYELSTGAPEFFFFRKPYTVQLVPRPDRDYRVRMDITVSVTPDTTTVPEVFFTEMADYVAYGALSRILAMTGQTFSNAQSAEMYRVRYEQSIATIKSEAMSGFQRNGGRVLFNRII